MEEWRPIPGFEGYYEVSNLGRIRNSKRNTILNGCMNSRGYIAISLSTSKKFKSTLVHIVVCTVFNGPKPFKGALCLHWDDIGSNNTPDNLYWGNHEKNAEDAKRNGLLHTGPRPRT